MKSILIASSSFSGAGIGSYVRSLGHMLVNRGFSITFLLPRSAVLDYERYSMSGSVEYFDIPVHSDSLSESIVIKKIFDFISDSNFDVIINNDNIYIQSLLPYLKSEQVKISVSHFTGGIIEKATIQNYEYCDWIIAISEAGKRSICSSISKDHWNKVQVLYNAMSDLNCPIVRKCGENIKIIFLGGSNRRKNPKFVRKLCNNLSGKMLPIEFLWVGEIPFFSEKLKASVDFSIQFTGKLAHEEVLEHLSESAYVLIPSKGEGCPMAFIEGVRSGVIPIVSDCPSAMREIVEDCVSGYICRTNSKGVFKASEAIRSGLNDQNMLYAMQLASRELYDNYFNDSDYIARLESMFEIKNTKFETKGLDSSSVLLKWHRRPGRWCKPTIHYIKHKLAIISEFKYVAN